MINKGMIFYLRALLVFSNRPFGPIGLCHFYSAYGTSALIFKANIPIEPSFLKIIFYWSILLWII
ncbi:hypothetical protein DHD32_13935 [Arenibacter sp. TNZ]|nr:hypothetical protein [Arenibacter sp. TNZ]